MAENVKKSRKIGCRPCGRERVKWISDSKSTSYQLSECCLRISLSFLDQKLLTYMQRYVTMQNSGIFFIWGYPILRSTTYIFFFSNYAKKYMNLKMRCSKSVCHFIYYNGLKIDETTCRSSKRHVISEKDTY